MMSFLERLARWARGRIVRWWKRRMDLAELYSLDERSLADIGLTRADIPYVVYERRTRRGSTPRPSGSRAVRAPQAAIRAASVKRCR